MLLSPFAIMFTALQDYITAQVPEIKWIDQEFGQLENYKEGYRPAVLFPCVLIDFTGWRFEDAGQKVQTGIGDVDIRIAFEPYTNTSQVTPIAQREKALQCYELEKKLYQALHGWNPSKTQGVFIQKLQRTTTDTEKREDTIRVRIMRFATGFKDTSATEPLTVPAPNPVVGGDMIQ